LVVFEAPVETTGERAGVAPEAHTNHRIIRLLIITNMTSVEDHHLKIALMAPADVRVKDASSGSS
jgi:hypothetical protein